MLWLGNPCHLYLLLLGHLEETGHMLEAVPSALRCASLWQDVSVASGAASQHYGMDI